MNIKEYYNALIARDESYEGVFYVGVKTTGVFCRPTCPARKPKVENCEFYKTAEEALLAGYRPCKRCRPLSHPNEVSDVVGALVAAVEADPSKRWKGEDFRNLSIDESTARRQFKKRFGMTFVEYARARRMGLAMEGIRAGSRVIDVQVESGYESGSGFRDAFSRVMGVAPVLSEAVKVLKASWIDTRLGPMLGVGDDEKLYLLEFVDRRGLEREIERLRSRVRCAIVPGPARSLETIEEELGQYFDGELSEFKTPIEYVGTPFQWIVWDELRKIPLGETRSYKELAEAIGNEKGFRAVARANGANQLAIVVPCHRVVNANGELGGYGGGVWRKEWIIAHEKRMALDRSIEV